MNRKSFLKTVLLGGFTSLTAAFSNKPKTVKVIFDNIEYLEFPFPMTYKGKRTGVKTTELIGGYSVVGKYYINEKEFQVKTIKIIKRLDNYPTEIELELEENDAKSKKPLVEVMREVEIMREAVTDWVQIRRNLKT